MEQIRVKLANAIELDVVDVGPRDGPVLIFLHGFPDSHRTWRHQIAHLSGRYRCIAPDQRGYRGSSKPVGVENYTPDKLIGDVFQLADALGVGPFTIVGHDWGGAIAWGVAIMGQLNGRVTRAVVMNAPHPTIFPKLLYTNRQQRQASQYFRVFRDSASDELVEQFGLGGVLLKAFGEVPENPKMDPAERAALMEDYANREASIAMLNWYRASPMEVLDMDAPYELPAGYQPPALPKLTIPTLVVWAMDDIALPAANLDGLDEVIEDLTLVQVPGCGHFVQWEAPDEVNAALDGFLARTGHG
ncbi:alpha/beta fold hydrolase [Novosphingobium ginsenosidimutans]|uniref:Alpha/beta hydrolase n=1 Tax=Novosphingobium ginsenosidimutans TaxID=1176536 RepID=A0A5B8S963_9SPHN|nr:alpha/beta hydrolase [Novosphingobium ginsenosidimutans]QEA17332.1 alpha/beta hydrolase [Novosphingobium ginsenosidimutans]